MSIYIINLILIIFLYVMLFKLYRTEKSKKIFCIIVFILFSLIQGLRSFEVGNDTNNYIKFFELSKNIPWIDIILMKQWSIEPGYGLIMKICSTMSFTPQMFLLTVSIIINGGLMYYIYKYSDNPFISVIIFIGVEFFTLSFTALRQMIAVIILLNSYKFIKEKKFIKFILLVLLASTIHKTALIFLPVYFFRDININKKTIYLGIIIFFISQLISIPLIVFLTKNLFTEAYIKSEYGGITQTLVILAYLILGILVYRKSIITEKGINNIMFIIIYFAFLIQSLACRINMVNRLMWYFYIFIIAYLPNMKKDINENLTIKQRKIKLSTIYEYIIILLSITQYLFFSIDMYSVVPYHILNI